MNGYDTKGLFIASGFMILAGLGWLAYYHFESGSALLFICFLSLLAGLFLEVGSVTRKWKVIWILVLASCFLSLLFLMPGEDSDFATKARYWPLVFCSFFTLFSWVVFQDAFISKLSEGLVMLQSTALTYWIIDLRLWEWDSLLLKVILFSPILMVIFSLFHAFSSIKLGLNSRLVLSMWSALLMLAFAADNFWGLIFGDSVEDATDWSTMALFTIKYFLSGASLIYVVQSFFLFIPRNDDLERTVDLQKLHIERFSPVQADHRNAWLALLFSLVVYGINFSFNVVPRQIAIWSVIILFPMSLTLFGRLSSSPKP